MSNTNNLLICYNSLPLFANHVLDYPEPYYTQHGVKRLHNHDTFDVDLIKDGDVVCVKSDFIDNGMFYREFFHRIKSKFKLVTGISSLPCPRGEGIHEMLASPNLIAWYPCHINPEYANHSKVFPMPIGFTEQSRDNGNQEMLWEMRNGRTKFEDKEDSFFLPYHDLRTNKIREGLVEKAINSGIKLEYQAERLPIRECLSLINNCKYVICLEGSGIDTHRVYECLLMDCVPIMKRTPLEKMFLKYNLPGIFVDSWDDLGSDAQKQEFMNSIDESEFDFSNNEKFLLAKTHGDFISNEHSSNVITR